MYGILFELISWLNYNILSFSDGIEIPQISLFLHTFSWYLSLFSVLKECLIIPLNNVFSLLQDNAILLFLRLESLIELFVSHNWN